MLGHAALRTSNQRTANIFTPAKTSWALACLQLEMRWVSTAPEGERIALPHSRDEVLVSFLKAVKLFLDPPPQSLRKGEETDFKNQRDQESRQGGPRFYFC